MERKLVDIRNIRAILDRDREIVATFYYRLPTSGIRSFEETVLFNKPYPFTYIVGAEFNEHKIDEWIQAHGGKWDKVAFLLDKIKERGGFIDFT